MTGGGLGIPPVPGPARPSTAEPETATSAPRDLFRREGEFWTLAHRGMLCRLRDAKGLRAIAFLLRHPNQEFHAVDLAAAIVESRTGSRASEASPGCSARLGDAGALLDADAKTAYRRRLDSLKEDLAEAQRFQDLGRVEKTRAEIRFLTEELARAVGLGGRDRVAASSAERARLAVTKSIKSALRKIGQHHLSLGHHLKTSIRTGAFCAYIPHPADPIRWTF
jgi:non-specific serine/threonine protein kinase